MSLIVLAVSQAESMRSGTFLVKTELRSRPTLKFSGMKPSSLEGSEARRWRVAGWLKIGDMMDKAMTPVDMNRAMTSHNVVERMVSTGWIAVQFKKYTLREDEGLYQLLKCSGTRDFQS